MKPSLIQLYMDMAERVAKESYCPRGGTGCVFVLESGLIAIGFNGTAPGLSNECEVDGLPDPEVIHAEMNAAGKLLEEGVSARGAYVFLTLSPCIECAKLLVKAKVKSVWYKEPYRLTNGINYLKKCGIEVRQIATN